MDDKKEHNEETEVKLVRETTAAKPAVSEMTRSIEKIHLSPVEAVLIQHLV